MNDFNQTMVGDIVASNFLSATIFSKYGIDFCCGGQITLADICKKKNIPLAALQKDLEDFFNTQPYHEQDYQNWPLDKLITQIETVHHHYIKDRGPIIQTYLAKLVKVHGSNHPELLEINELFNIMYTNLCPHMEKEEKILFPYIKELAMAATTNSKIHAPAFGHVENPIHIMNTEHEEEGERLHKIIRLSNNFEAPLDACNTYKAAYAALDDFNKDLQLHIHLENNIIFKKAIAIEAQTLFLD